MPTHPGSLGHSGKGAGAVLASMDEISEAEKKSCAKPVQAKDRRPTSACLSLAGLPNSALGTQTTAMPTEHGTQGVNTDPPLRYLACVHDHEYTRQNTELVDGTQD
ncbi:hypothetical protein C8R44DRAFT_874359 [Mycena epipterygia]|nr:hypothetical protein C8R44DRAFT_874359 [Mycena epipterygia]